MLNRGDRQHDIAAWFGVNGGRIAEIANGEKSREVEAATIDLPPKGPYVSGQRALKTLERLEHIRTALEQAITEVDTAIAELSEEAEPTE